MTNSGIKIIKLRVPISNIIILRIMKPYSCNHVSGANLIPTNNNIGHTKGTSE